jgi:beta-lactamase regulating signal transducer with metallopeptidase domain
MTILNLHAAFWGALGAALLHLLWQGGTIALVVAVAQPWLQRKSAAVRYLIAGAGLFALPVVFAATLSRLVSGGADLGLALPVNPAWLPAVAPYVAVAWIAGLFGLGTYAGAGWILALRLRQRAHRAVPDAWQVCLADLSRRMAVRARVSLGLSNEVNAPCVLGWWRPVVLLPVGLLTGLSLDQCQAVLAHELAHVRRHDYLVNLVQRAVEVVFFYHPAVWWLSHRMSEERELCCDDVAVATCGSRGAYAAALLDLAGSRNPASIPQVAMAATGGRLRLRVARLLGHPAGRRGGSMMLASGAFFLLLTSAGLYLGARPGPARLPLPPVAAAPAPVAQARYVAAPRPASTASAEPADAPRVQPRAQAQFVGFTLEQVQRCIPSLAMQRVVLPSGQEVWQVRTVTQCVPVIQPMEVWVMSSM